MQYADICTRLRYQDRPWGEYPVCSEVTNPDNTMSTESTEPTDERPVESARRVGLDEYTESAREVVIKSGEGVPTAVIGRDGKIKMTVGMNGRQFFPDPDPDPLAEIEKDC